MEGVGAVRIRRHFENAVQCSVLVVDDRIRVRLVGGIRLCGIAVVVIGAVAISIIIIIIATQKVFVVVLELVLEVVLFVGVCVQLR